jgi:putative ABC transport system permease protein
MFYIDIIKRALRNLLSAKARTILTALAIAVGTFALTLTLGASNGAQNYAQNIVKTNFDPSELLIAKDTGLFKRQDASRPQLYDPSYGSITTFGGETRQVKMLDDKDIQKLAKIKGVSSAQPGINVSLQYLTRDNTNKYIGTLTPYNPYQNPTLLAGKILAQLQDNTIILPEGFLGSLGFIDAQSAINQTIKLSVLSQATSSMVPGASKSQVTDFKIIAVYKTPNTAISAATSLNLYASLGSVENLNNFIYKGTGNYQKYLEAVVKVTDGTNTTKLNDVENLIKAQGYGVQSVIDTEKTITQIIGVLEGIVTVFGIIAIIASVFGVVNTMYISVLQRTREIGLMKALGMHRKDISRLFRIEAGLIGLLGGIIGSLIAIVGGTGLNPVISSKLGLGDSKLLIFKFSQVGLLIIALIIIGIIAGLLPARKAAHLDPIEALRTE